MSMLAEKRVALPGLCAMMSLAAFAQTGVVYTYTGNPLTHFTGNYSCSAGVGECRVTGSFTVAAPLPANLNLPESSPYALQLLSFSFTDGVRVFDQNNAPCGYACSGPEIQIFATDGQGLPTAWIIQIQTGGFSPRYEVGSANEPAGTSCCVDDSAYHYNSFGQLDGYAANGNDAEIAGGNSNGVPGTWTVSGSGSGSGSGSCANDVTSQVRVGNNGFHWVAPFFFEYSTDISITNQTNSPIPGPIYLVLDGLPSSTVTTLISFPLTFCGSASGSYLIQLNNPELLPNQPADLELVFLSQTSGFIPFRPRVFSGAPTQ